MKKLILVAILLCSIANFAQEKKSNNKKNDMEQMTPAQRNDLNLKKMTLELDLNDKQQKEMSIIINEMSAKRESQKSTMMAMKEKGEKPTADQKFEMKNKMLDEKIAMKSRVQKILTPAQFEKWENMQHKNNKHKKAKKAQKTETKEE